MTVGGNEKQSNSQVYSGIAIKAMRETYRLNLDNLLIFDEGDLAHGHRHLDCLAGVALRVILFSLSLSLSIQKLAPWSSDGCEFRVPRVLT